MAPVIGLAGGNQASPGGDDLTRDRTLAKLADLAGRGRAFNQSIEKQPRAKKCWGCVGRWEMCPAVLIFQDAFYLVLVWSCWCSPGFVESVACGLLCLSNGSPATNAVDSGLPDAISHKICRSFSSGPLESNGRLDARSETAV